jgi:threonine/homoserine/homoserine lactone efflux protein
LRRRWALAYSDLVSAFLLNLTNPTAVLSFLGLLAALGLGHPRRWWSTLSLVGGIFCGSIINRVAGLAIGGFGVALMVLGPGQNFVHNFFHFLSR